MFQNISYSFTIGLLKGIMDNENTIIIDNKIIAYFLLPRNDGYHLIHHLLPVLAVEKFNKAHILLMEDTTYKSLEHHGLAQFKAWIK